MSMAAISREAGLHKDWVCRRLPAIAPHVAGARRHVQPHPGDLRLRPAAHRLGYLDVGAYLRTEHAERHRTVAALAVEAGVSRTTVVAALRRYDINQVPHAAKRYQAEQRDSAISRSLGFDSIANYVVERRGRGLPWKSLVEESGLPESTLRRRRGPRAAQGRPVDHAVGDAGGYAASLTIGSAYSQRRSAAAGSTDHSATPVITPGPPLTTSTSWLSSK